MTNSQPLRQAADERSSLATWRKSSYSGGSGGSCVECASTAWTPTDQATPRPVTVALRDSKHPGLGHLAIPHAERAAFLGAVRTGDL